MKIILDCPGGSKASIHILLGEKGQQESQSETSRLHAAGFVDRGGNMEPRNAVGSLKLKKAREVSLRASRRNPALPTPFWLRFISDLRSFKL